MSITIVVIPAHTGEPTRKQELNPADLDAYQGLVHGNIDIVRLETPEAGLIINDEGKLLGLRPNPRATALLWVHNPPFRGQDIIVGDAVLVGSTDEDGNDLSAPDELVKLILNVNRFYVEEQTPTDEEWHGDGHVFTNWYAAYRWAAIRSSREDVSEVRVVEAK